MNEQEMQEFVKNLGVLDAKQLLKTIASSDLAAEEEVAEEVSKITENQKQKIREKKAIRGLETTYFYTENGSRVSYYDLFKSFDDLIKSEMAEEVIKNADIVFPDLGLRRKSKSKSRNRDSKSSSSNPKYSDRKLSEKLKEAIIEAVENGYNEINSIADYVENNYGYTNYYATYGVRLALRDHIIEMDDDGTISIS